MRRLPVAIVSLLLFYQNFVSACECGPPAAACAYVNGASAVFVGKVVFSNDDGSGTFVQKTLVHFEVEEAFKGLPPGTRDVWIDPGSFTSCYAEYKIGERWLIFASSGFRMPVDTAAVSVVQSKNAKPLPAGIDPSNPPTVYSAPECSGSRLIVPETQASVDPDLQYLRQFSAGTAVPTVTGRVNPLEFYSPSGMGLSGAKVTLSGNGLALSALTDSNGRYSFSPVPVGKYSLHASIPSYLSASKQESVEVSTSGCAYAEFVMVGTGAIQGSLIDQANHPVHNVRVQIARLGADGQPDTLDASYVDPDRSGTYRFAGLSEGTFAIGVNVYDAPAADAPYKETLWTRDGTSAIHLNPGEKKYLSPLKLPAAAKVHKIQVEVHWPDGRPAQGVTVLGYIGSKVGDLGETDAVGVTHLPLLEGFTYKVEAKIWVGSEDIREVARSGPTQWNASSGLNHLTLVLTQRSKQYD